ncbi:MAG: ATP-binding cassette domain-containing protein [Coriobacteriia bacterium]|nr:ATP-binding cassette domain-containing protein [Coriobacteriia bacterium]MCL2870673.1 ATP-binding cassette domain-containing protein [Coriobacteriia bacterium]
MLALNKVNLSFNTGTVNEVQALKDLGLLLEQGDFVVVIGGNGSGKSTMLNTVSGTYLPDNGKIVLDGKDITFMPEHVRAKYVGRVFQDPMRGTAPDMTIEENLALAHRRGEKRSFRRGIRAAERTQYRELLSRLDLGLEDRLNTRIGLLSGGQRQAITLLMATLQNPKVLLLDEHTAALDPKTAAKVLEISVHLIEESYLTTLMVTHNMADAIKYGNRLVLMREGEIIFEATGQQKASLTVPELVDKFISAGVEVLV